jgi:hypothetical protein
MLQTYKPGSVLRHEDEAAIIYLSRCLRNGINLPTLYPSAKGGIGRAALRGYYTWHFSMQGLPAIDVATNSRELLPHVFSLTCSFSQRARKRYG